VSLRYLVKYECMSQKWRQSEIRIVINYKSQGSIAKRLRNNELLHYTFINQSAGERILFKLVNIWRSRRQNGDCFMRPHSPSTFVLKDADLDR